MGSCNRITKLTIMIGAKCARRHRFDSRKMHYCGLGLGLGSGSGLRLGVRVGVRVLAHLARKRPDLPRALERRGDLMTSSPFHLDSI